MGIVLLELGSSEMASGATLPARAIGWFQFVFWLCLVCLAFQGAPEVSALHLSWGLKIVVSGLLALGLLTSDNFRSVTKDAIVAARPWHAFMTAMLQEHGTIVDVDRVPAPRTFFSDGLSEDSGSWVNRCAADYMGVDTLVVRRQSGS
jgi:hypothetical protein